MKKSLVFAATVAAMFASSSANAQKYMTTGIAETASGVEGGGGYQQALGRARTRARIGAELWIDENPSDVLNTAFLLDIEPRSAFGADARYTRRVGTTWAFGIGAIGYFAPATLVGPVIGAGAIVILKNVMSAYTARWLLILGIVYIVTILWAPQGLWNLGQRRRA